MRSRRGGARRREALRSGATASVSRIEAFESGFDCRRPGMLPKDARLFGRRGLEA